MDNIKNYEPEFRCPTQEAISNLAERFSLPNKVGMQDWEYEVAEPNRIEEFFSVYKNSLLSDDEKFVLLEVLLESFEESDLILSEHKIWKKLLRLIEINFKIHEYTIWHWCAFEAENEEEQWRVTPYMRVLYATSVK